MNLQYTFNKNDEYYTPEKAVYPIIKYLNKGSIVWCPFDKEESNFVKILKEEGFNVIFSHIEYGQDFFEIEVPNCDYIISNPPYSLKNEVFKKLFEINKPFAMLINFQGIFDSKDRFEMFKENKIQMLWLSPRVNYIKLNTTKSSTVPFQSGYLCHKMLENDLMFENIKKENGVI